MKEEEIKELKELLDIPARQMSEAQMDRFDILADKYLIEFPD